MSFYILILQLFLNFYISLQTFAIPGSISLSVLSGFLFPFPLALFLVCFCSATGASLCYMVSYFVGRKVIKKYFPEKAEKYSAMVSKTFNLLYKISADLPLIYCKIVKAEFIFYVLPGYKYFIMLIIN